MHVAVLHSITQML